MRFVKGHGTENDFVILPDPTGSLTLPPRTVARICDRRLGIGADGILRVVPAKAIDPGQGTAEWFMDYRNSDGSIAEMCGNGARVFARYLVDSGIAAPGTWPIATRAGLRTVTVGTSGDVSVEMGSPAVSGQRTATIGPVAYTGWRISMGNPHLACPVADPVADLDLSRAPGCDAADFPDGVNVEFFRPLAPHHVEMRVYERGSGETRSCGTGAVATAVAAALAAGSDLSGDWTVDVLGGRVTVALTATSTCLTGPAVLVAEGTLNEAWLNT